MKANPDKCHLLLSTNQNKLTKINSNVIHNSSSEKLLGITIHTKLKFDIHINNLCKKACQKLSALRRILSCLVNVNKRQSVMKALTVCI